MVLQSIPEVKAFTEEIGRSGKWNGEALEGFVVRTHATKGLTKDRRVISPYAAGSSFFKVKFDEPYMMYRDWREVTKTLLLKGGDIKKLPKSKLRREETKVYVNWVVEEIKRDRSQFDEFQKGRGIIATRERFLKWMQSHDGQSARNLAKEEAPQGGDEKKFGKTIIVPVAIPGVGRWLSGVREQCSHLMFQARPQLRLHYRTSLDLVILKATIFKSRKLRAPLLRMSLNYSKRMMLSLQTSCVSPGLLCPLSDLILKK